MAAPAPVALSAPATPLARVLREQARNGRAVARAVGMDINIFHAITAGRRKLQLDEAATIAAFLGVDVTTIVDDADAATIEQLRKAQPLAEAS